jgi:superfamily I DNA and RNA helicase
MNYWMVKRRVKERFAEFYFTYVNPDAPWCKLVMWYAYDSDWPGGSHCTGCDYCGRVSYGVIPRSALNNLFFHPSGKHFSDHIFTSVKEVST